jgi:hypothetical protein
VELSFSNFWANLAVLSHTKFWAMYATVVWPRDPQASTLGRTTSSGSKDLNEAMLKMV